MNIRIVDLFAGIGGIRLGFEQAFGKENVDCVFSSEINKFAVETYKANFGEENIYGDITKIDASGIPDHDVLLAGFPCQPYSNAGLHKSFDDPRANSFFEIERILLKKKPKMFLLENVKHMRNIDGGRAFRTIKKHLNKAGYKVFHHILSGKDFGAPQNRERLFIVGISDLKAYFEFPKPLNIPTKVGDILEQNVDTKYTLSDKNWEYEQKRSHKNTGVNGFGCKVFNEQSPYTRTLLATNYENILIEQHGKNPRRLTVRERARLQGFPDSFVMDKVSYSQACKQLGNSVCVPVVKAIAEQMKNFMSFNFRGERV